MSRAERIAAAPGTSKDRLRAWLRILRAQRLIEADLRERLRLTYGSTLPRFDVMAALDWAPDGLRMSDLSARLKVSNGNVTGIVDRLEGDGLVEREAVAGDRRAMRVRLTDAGRAAFTAMAGDHEAWLGGFFEDLDGSEVETLVALLSRIGRDEAKGETA